MSDPPRILPHVMGEEDRAQHGGGGHGDTPVPWQSFAEDFGVPSRGDRKRRLARTPSTTLRVVPLPRFARKEMSDPPRILPHVMGEGDRAQHGGGGHGDTPVPWQSFAEDFGVPSRGDRKRRLATAPSTTLRVVPLPRFAREDMSDPRRLALLGPSMTIATSLAHPVPRRSARRRFTLALEPYLYTVPSVFLIALIMLVPLIVGLSFAFRDLTLLDPDSGGFVGLDNFRQLWADASFWNALRNTVTWTASSVILQFTLGLTLALLLDKPFPGRGVIQALVFLPWAVPSFLSGLNWAWLFNPVVGPLPYWFVSLGLMATPDNLLSSPDHAIWGPIIANVWWGIPFFAITLLAALQSIPKDIYEAAAIDGAGALQRFRSITLPFLAPTIAITVLLRTVWIANFADLIVVMTKGGPADSTQILSSYIFTIAFQRLDFGYASAVAAVLLVLLLAYAMALVVLRQALMARS